MAGFVVGAVADDGVGLDDDAAATGAADEGFSVGCGVDAI